MKSLQSDILENFFTSGPQWGSRGCTLRRIWESLKHKFTHFSPSLSTQRSMRMELGDEHWMDVLKNRLPSWFYFPTSQPNFTTPTPKHYWPGANHVCSFFFSNWGIIALQYCVDFCHITTWISHKCTYVPSLLNLPPTSHPIPPLSASQSSRLSSLYWTAASL